MNYRNVYYYIETGYKMGVGLEEEKTESFYNEIKPKLENNGWDVNVPYATNGKNKLFIHPMQISCDIQENMIDDMKALLSSGKTFKLRYVKELMPLEDLTDDEYLAWLESNKTEIETELLNAFKTKRKDLFVVGSWQTVEKIKEKYHKARIGSHIGRSSNDVECKFVYGIFNNLVETNKISECNTRRGTGYKTISQSFKFNMGRG